jgi:hypothetical protein
VSVHSVIAAIGCGYCCRDELVVSPA